MKAKTKRRLIHVVTKKRLLKRKHSKHILRSFLILVATVSMGSLAYAITLSKPTVGLTVHGSKARVLEIKAATPVPQAPGAGPAQSGRGSWYALGLPEPDALTCASRTFPRGTFLNVTNLRTHRSVVCRVNDYGPEAWTARVIDLSRGSFRQFDSLGSGTAPVEIRVAGGPSGFNLDTRQFAAVVGYSQCHHGHTPQFCEFHRQD